MSTTDRSVLSILVVGCGSIGQRHIRNLQALGTRMIAACDLDGALLDRVVSEFNVVGYRVYAEALDKVSPDAVVICTPPPLHISQAMDAIARGAHVFVEKPISHSLDGTDDLIQVAATAKRVIQVGYNFRFHRGLKRVKALVEEGTIGRVLWARAEFGQYLPEWRPMQDYRTSYTAHRSLGGGIILDSSHEIDYMRWLFGEIDQVYCLAGTLSDLEVAAEDTACMTVHFASGVVGQIHVDFVQRVKTRNCKIVGTLGTIYWDNWDASVKVFTIDSGKWERIEAPSDTNEKYFAEMNSFLGCLDGSVKPVVDAESGRRTLAVALAAQHSARTNATVAIPFIGEHIG
ncbi:MAG: Gfo/Idh/MocA family oxidoreductase [Verrucomicrobia bacterium]|nr:Gfo/Idh/MocA family oxidoreductase [Verrucomicrobiota bacterium]